MVLYSAVSSPLDRSKRFTLSSPGRPVHSDTVLGFSWKHSSHAAIAQRLFTHMSTTVYSQVLIYTAESTEASRRERKCPNFRNGSKGDSNPGSLDCESGILPLSYGAPLNSVGMIVMRTVMKLVNIFSAHGAHKQAGKLALKYALLA